MTVRDVLETQSLQLPEYSCENSVPIPQQSKIEVLGGGQSGLLTRDNSPKNLFSPKHQMHFKVEHHTLWESLSLKSFM